MNPWKQLTATLLTLTVIAILTTRALAADAPVTKDFDAVLVYPTLPDGSIMHWLAISPLKYDVAYIGDSLSADVLEGNGKTELTIRPRAGDQVQKQMWHKMHYAGEVEGPTMCGLFAVAGYGFNFAITDSVVYVYSPVDRPNAVLSGSADDGLKMIVNGKKIWTNQIQRSPTYDSDQAHAPLKKGWNTVLMVVDQVIGGHLLCARFLDNNEPLTDLEISLDPPTENATRYPAGPYNKEASALMRTIDELKADDKLPEALAACEQALAKYSLADVAPRMSYTRAMIFYNPAGEKSLDQPDKAADALQSVLTHYPQDALAEYAMLDLGRVQETALKSPVLAEAIFRSFEDRFPLSLLAPKSTVEVARLLAQGKKFEDALLAYRKVLKKYPKSDEVMTATVGIADTYRLAGDKEKAARQYQVAMTMAKDWHDNKYGVDVGKQAWLSGIMETIRPFVVGK